LLALNVAIKLREDVVIALPEIEPVKLNVPWLSQLGATASYAKGDCGTACIAMLANFLGHHCTVDDVSIITGKPRDFAVLYYNELIATALHYHFTLRYFGGATLDKFQADIEAGKPVIVLVNYKSLPDQYDKAYNAGHYIVLTGYDSSGVFYHDPYQPDEAHGAYKYMTRAQFMVAYSTKAPKNTNAFHSLRLA